MALLYCIGEVFVLTLEIKTIIDRCENCGHAFFELQEAGEHASVCPAVNSPYIAGDVVMLKSRTKNTAFGAWEIRSVVPNGDSYMYLARAVGYPSLVITVTPGLIEDWQE